MVSDLELINRLQEIIRSSDLDKTSAASVRRQMEAEFGVSLNDRKAFIREQINSFIATHFSQNDNSNPQPPEEKTEQCQDKEENVSDDVEKEVGSEGMKNEGNGSGKDDGDEESAEELLKKNSDKVDKVVKRKGGGFSKPSALSPQLQELVGVPELARTEVVKKIWVYIKENNLQIPSNKKKIKCDKILRGVFQVDTVDMFKMNKLLSKHIWPIEEYDQGEEKEEEKKVNASDDVEKQLESEGIEAEGNDDNGSGDDEGEGEEGEESDKVIIKKNSHCDKIVKRKGGFSKPSALSPQLQELVGVPELARTEVVRKIWAHIREKNLQDPNNKKKIMCDKILRGIFKVDTVDMFKMNKLLTKHIWPIEEYVSPTPVKSPKMERQKKQARREGKDDEPKVKEKRQKRQNSGFLAPLPLSDSLVKFLGTGDDSLSRSEVVKRMWQYIKENELQDPADRRRILCDNQLKELFEVDSFNGISITKLLAAHFIKRD